MNGMLRRIHPHEAPESRIMESWICLPSHASRVRRPTAPGRALLARVPRCGVEPWRTPHWPRTARREPLSSRSPGTATTQIAHELGLANRGTAWHMVQNALKERPFAAVDAYREAELKRLQRVEDQLWPRPGRHARAAGGMRVVINQRVRLLGLDQVATRESNRCTCECPIHGSHGSWRPTRRVEDALNGFDPPAELVADVEERMESWVGEIGVWAVFQVMTMIAQVMEMVARAEEVGDSA